MILNVCSQNEDKQNPKEVNRAKTNKLCVHVVCRWYVIGLVAISPLQKVIVESGAVPICTQGRMYHSLQMI